MNETNWWMQTYTGKKFYPMEPRAEDIDIRDIAHALSQICRYGGHTTKFYSVAEHCLLMSYEVSAGNALWTLLHDASEAYMGDMIRPLKYQMDAYRAAENKVVECVMDKFELPHEQPQEVHEMDMRIVIDEKNTVMRKTEHEWNFQGIDPLGIKIYGMQPAVVEQAYLDRFRTLTAARKKLYV